MTDINPDQYRAIIARYRQVNQAAMPISINHLEEMLTAYEFVRSSEALIMLDMPPRVRVPARTKEMVG